MSVRLSWRLFLFTLLSGVAAGFARPPGGEGDAPAPPAAQTFVGPVTNAVASARVGLVADGSAYILYVCSQDEVFNKANARWARGAVAGGKFEGKSPDGAMTVRGSIGPDAAEGVIAVGGKEMPFRAKAADTRTYAGLYRCEEKEGAHDYVAGWVVDEDDDVAGAVQNRQTRQIANPPGVVGQKKNPGIVSPRDPASATGGNRIPNLNPGQGTGVAGQQVTDPNNPATGAGKKFVEQDFLNQTQQVATNLEKKGGSPLFALTIQQVRRVVSGAKASGPIEAKTFAKLGRVPRATLASYLKRWDDLPAATRQRILGPAASQVAANTALTPDVVNRTLSAFRRGASSAAPPQGGPTISSIRFTQLQCVNPADVRKDEIVYTCLVLSGTTGVGNVSTTYTGIKKGDTRTFNARDSQFWPAANTTQATPFDTSVAVSLFDDDSRLRRGAVDTLRALADSAGDIAASGDGITGGDLAALTQNMLEATAAAIDSARLIGTDALIVKAANKQAVSGTNQPKNELRFLRPGVNAVDYRIRGLAVN